MIRQEGSRLIKEEGKGSQKLAGLLRSPAGPRSAQIRPVICQAADSLRSMETGLLRKIAWVCVISHMHPAHMFESPVNVINLR